VVDVTEQASTGPETTGYHADTHALLNRLRRIEGQVRGLQRTVESEAYCIDVLTQVSAVTRALQNVAISLLDDHRNCVIDAAQLNPQDASHKLEEATLAIARLVRS
jgi:DNA-binding FrmR family transcriptional regulator